MVLPSKQGKPVKMGWGDEQDQAPSFCKRQSLLEQQGGLPTAKSNVSMTTAKHK